MSKRLSILLIWFLTLIFSGCSKKNDSIALGEQYLQVADVVEYCQTNCDEVASWEQSEVLVKGHLRNVGNDSLWSINQEKSRFYLLDIRNGFSLEINVEDDQDLIFSRLLMVKKSDLVFITGTAKAVIAQDGANCIKGVVLLINQDKDIIINLE